MAFIVFLIIVILGICLIKRYNRNQREQVLNWRQEQINQNQYRIMQPQETIYMNPQYPQHYQYHSPPQYYQQHTPIIQDSHNQFSTYHQPSNIGYEFHGTNRSIMHESTD